MHLLSPDPILSARWCLNVSFRPFTVDLFTHKFQFLEQGYLEDVLLLLVVLGNDRGEVLRYVIVIHHMFPACESTKEKLPLDWIDKKSYDSYMPSPSRITTIT